MSSDSFPEEPARNRSQRSGDAGDSADVEGGRRALDFADADAVLRGGLGDDAEDAWTAHAFGGRRDAEIAGLSEWADKTGAWIPPASFRERVRGRMEHEILRIGDPLARVVKITTGQKFGFRPYCDPMLVSGMVDDWFSLRAATPLEYIRRMALTHALFPALDHRLEGFAILGDQFRIVISQRFVDPVPATPTEIANFFTGAGFRQMLPEAYYRAADNVAIFDAGTTNVIQFEDHLFPIDVLPIRPAGFLLERILSALGIPFGSP